MFIEAVFTLAQITLTQNLEGYLAFAPDGLAAYAGPAGRVDIGDEFGEVAFIFGHTHNASYRVRLAGVTAAAFRLHSPAFEAGHADGCGADADGFEVEVERAGSVEPAQRTDAVANASEEDGEFRAAGDPALMLEFQWREEVDMDFRRRGGRWVEIERGRFD